MGDLQRVHQSLAIKPSLVSTLFTPPPGFAIQQQVGIVRGITVRSRNVIASIGAGLRALVSGMDAALLKHTACVDLCISRTSSWTSSCVQNYSLSEATGNALNAASQAQTERSRVI